MNIQDPWAGELEEGLLFLFLPRAANKYLGIERLASGFEPLNHRRIF